MSNQLSKLKMLNLNQLLDRWHSKFSLENILQWADEGIFGIYVKPNCKRRTYYKIQEHVDLYTNQRKDNSLSLKLENFKNKYPYLLQPIANFERLATFIEVEIKGVCSSGSIQKFMKSNKLVFTDFNNTFGFVELNCLDGKALPDIYQKEHPQDLEKLGLNFEKSIIAPSYLLQATTNIARPFLPEGYKGCFSKEDLFFAVEQIEAYESQNKDIFAQRNVKQEKTKQTREHALKTLIFEVYEKEQDKSAINIWKYLKKLAQDPHDTLSKVDLWSAYCAKITWIKSNGQDSEMMKKTFQNYISGLKKEKS